MNTAERDQLRAATADADRRLRSAARHAEWNATDLPGPVVAVIAHRFTAALDGARHCGHVSAPQPCLGHAWRPGFVMCGPCSTLAAHAVKGTPEDGRCDGCGQLSWTLTTGATLVGPIAVAFGLCDPCTRTERAARSR